MAVPLAVCRVLLGATEEALGVLLEDEQIGASLGCAALREGAGPSTARCGEPRGRGRLGS